jgi:hypothetical protein
MFVTTCFVSKFAAPTVTASVTSVCLQYVFSSHKVHFSLTTVLGLNPNICLRNWCNGRRCRHSDLELNSVCWVRSVQCQVAQRSVAQQVVCHDSALTNTCCTASGVPWQRTNKHTPNCCSGNMTTVHTITATSQKVMLLQSLALTSLLETLALFLYPSSFNALSTSVSSVSFEEKSFKSFESAGHAKQFLWRYE